MIKLKMCTQYIFIYFEKYRERIFILILAIYKKCSYRHFIVFTNDDQDK